VNGTYASFRLRDSSLADMRVKATAQNDILYILTFFEYVLSFECSLHRVLRGSTYGDIAQLGERLNGIQEVASSILAISKVTKNKYK
jgi:hypothetical protein